MKVLLYVVPLLAGIINAIHSGTNAKLTETLKRPYWAAVIVCFVSGLCMFIGVAAVCEAPPSLKALAATPWWAWLGTAFAAVPVITTLLYAGRLGAAAFNGLVVTATIVASVVLDHYGLLGFSVHTVTPMRIVGALVMIAGMTLVCLY